ncbi:MAG: hypothetical protein ACUZ8O_15645 [Candidatus Anammoxibacter sp.]
MIKNIFNKHSFAALLCVSAIIHFGFIASSSKIRDLIKSNFGGKVKIDNPFETTIEFVLNYDTDNKDYLVKEEALDIIDEIAEDDTELEEKKRQLFVDSSHLQTDEDSLVDTDNIGEKGSIARDKKANDENVNEESFSDGKSEMLSLTKDAYSYVVQGANNSYQPESLIEEENIAEAESQQSLKSSKQEVEKEYEVTKEKIYKEEKDDLNRDDKKENIETTEISALTNEYEREELRTVNPEFERIIPVPLDLLPLKNNEQPDSEEIETPRNEVYKEVERERDLADLPEREKKKIVKEITELYEEYTDSSHNEFKQKPKVLMSVNGMSVYNVPAPSFKADLSNTTLFGEPSFNIRKHEYASYYKHIRDKISLYWLLYFGTDQSIKFTTTDNRPVIVEFKIKPSGKITDVIIFDDAGNPFLASRTQMSVTNTQLDEFPSFIEEEFIDVKFNFFFF